MQSIRTAFIRHRALCIMLMAAVLCLKALVPTGYMVVQDARILTVQICADATGQIMTTQIAIPMERKAGGQQRDHGKGEDVCPYSALSMLSLASVDAVLLAVAIALILALGIAPVRQSGAWRVPYLRPPLRGPPALI
ncbi:DUF2946 family protein [Sphingobium sp. AN558]|uniref:DUF2946 family protein n=1 Tax=Sphingobium sp. AN558 TaxID=3133442 RepID=UPI0030BAF7BE